jgi:putative RecB family exonuclease
MAFTQELPRALSPSRLSDFQSCPRKYQHASIERIPQPATYATAKGRFAHYVLEKLYALPAADRVIDAARSFLAPGRDEVLDEKTLADIDATNETVARMTNEVDGIIDTYFGMEKPSAVTVEGVERPVSVTIGGAPLYGILDRLDRTPEGDLVIVDYKTGRMPQGQWADKAFANTQLYAALLQADPEIGELPTAIRLLYIGEGKVDERAVGPKIAEARAKSASQAWEKITTYYQAGDFPATPGNACRFCAFKDKCRTQGIAVPF